MKKRGWPAIALVLGFLLGDPLEQRLRQSLVISGGDMTVLFQTSISKTLAALTLALVAFALYERRSTRSGEPE